jgi:salicylate hydroxylase
MPPKFSLDLPIAIIGAGPAGLALSIALKRDGKSHKLYESAENFLPVGASISLNPIAMAALEYIGLSHDQFVQLGATRKSDEGKVEPWLRFRHGQDRTPGFGSMIADVEAHGPTEWGGSFVYRYRLVEQMASLIPEGTIEFGKDLVGLQDTGTAIKLTFKDKTVSWVSAVVGCDGVWSVVRQAVLGLGAASTQPAFAGEYCYQGLVRMLLAREILGDEMITNGNIFCGSNGYVTTYPVAMDNGDFLNVTAVRRQSHSQPYTGARLQWCTTTDSAVQDFKDWGQPIIALLKTMHQPQKWGLFDSQAANYTKGLVCLLGDAAHASTPHQGAGVGMAFEDVCTLSHLLKGTQSSQDIRDSFHIFNKIRKPRTQRLVASSRAAGEVYEFAHKGVMDNIQKVRENLLARFEWIWSHDIFRELKKADQEREALSSARASMLLDDQWINSKRGVPNQAMKHSEWRGTRYGEEQTDEGVENMYEDSGDEDEDSGENDEKFEPLSN